MAEISGFNIRNFKGIKEASISFGSYEYACPVIMLMGLNECGKTTVLEAISNFVTKNEDVGALFRVRVGEDNLSYMIPKSRLSNFSDDIIIDASVILNLDDIEIICKFCLEKKIDIDPASITREFRVAQIYGFEDSVLVSRENRWEFSFNYYKKSKGKKVQVTAAPLPFSASGFDVWREVVMFVKNLLPKISYFPNFVVDVPKRIYLRKVASEAEATPYYRTVVQEVFDADGSGISVEKHINARIEDFKAKNGGKVDKRNFERSGQYSQINAAMHRFSSVVSREIIGNWENIFGRKMNARMITVTWDMDPVENYAPYISLGISDGGDAYDVSERSLGFRWFFSFLLFTKFKQKSAGNVIFLLDEPASNLHAKAQQQLLTAFGAIAEQNRIIYSTHSHHMVEPKWLRSSYIVNNKSIDVDDDIDNIGSFNRHTDIDLQEYSAFSSQAGSRSTYFQPVLDRLQYYVPPIAGEDNLILIEGITDFYIFNSIHKLIDFKSKITIIPGSGAGSLAPIVSSAIGRGAKFCIVLDDDAAGRKQKNRYQEKFYLSGSNVLTLIDLDEELLGKRLEGILDAETIDNMVQISGREQTSKKNIGIMMAELYATDKLIEAVSWKTRESVKQYLHRVYEIINLQ